MTFCRLALQVGGLLRCSVGVYARRSMSAAPTSPYNSLHPYKPPPWAEELKVRPTQYVQVGRKVVGGSSIFSIFHASPNYMACFS